jgi:hypothetical protein
MSCQQLRHIAHTNKEERQSSRHVETTTKQFEQIDNSKIERNNQRLSPNLHAHNVN